MTYRHFLGASALFLFFSITGCAKQQQTPQPDNVIDEPQQAERFSQLAQKDESAGPTGEKITDLNVGVTHSTQDILAQKTQSYAEEVERLLAARAAEKAAAMKQQQQRAPAPVAPVPAPVAPSPVATVQPPIKPAAAKSDVVFVDPKQLPASPTQAVRAVGEVSATADKKATIHQLLDTAPATANQATHIPGPGESVPVVVSPVVDTKPVPSAPQAVRQLSAESSDALARKLAERIKADPLDIAAHVDYQLLQMLNDQSVPELNAIATLPQEDREIISALLDGLSNFRNGIRTGGNALLGQKIAPIVDMGDRIRNQTTLSVSRLTLCRDVKQFGVYEPFDSARFPFGEKHPVVVYCEVANFASQLTSKSLWATKLTYEVLLYTDSSDASLQVWQQKATPVIDQSHSRRRDFFIAKLMELPQDLPIGGYLMKVSIVDETANRIAEATVPLQIVAK